MRSAITIDLGGHVLPVKEVDIKWGFCDSKAVHAFVVKYGLAGMGKSQNSAEFSVQYSWVSLTTVVTPRH